MLIDFGVAYERPVSFSRMRSNVSQQIQKKDFEFEELQNRILEFASHEQP